MGCWPSYRIEGDKQVVCKLKFVFLQDYSDLPVPIPLQTMTTLREPPTLDSDRSLQDFSSYKEHLGV